MRQVWHRKTGMAGLVLAVVGGFLVSVAPPAAADSNAEITDVNCTANVLPANDDNSTNAVDLPFNVDFYGHNYGALYVNNNGNVTFDQPLRTFTPFTIQADTPPIIAPFFADVDTRGAGSGVVTYGATTFGGRPAFCVDWNNVGYYPSQVDKLNSFQLLLVSRSDEGAGDFDIMLNYGTLKWETGSASGGSNGFGGTPAGAGFSAGDNVASHFFEFPGSRQTMALLDSNTDTGLINGSRGSLVLGRYVFGIRNGNAPGSASVTGTVYGPGNAPQVSSPVQICPTAGGSCVVGSTNSSGQYSVVGVAPGTYTAAAEPPAGSSLTPAQAGPFTLGVGDTENIDLALTGPTPPPVGTSIVNEPIPSANGIPVVYWTEPTMLDTTGCANGTASYVVKQGATTISSGALTESPVGSGHFHADVPAFYPNHGNADVIITTTCPGGGSSTTTFDIYIDPSGTVVDTHSNPVQGATVTLLRSDTAAGPFVAVPDGSAILSPSNRSNPVTSLADGTFHWDAIAGYYEVKASKAGCTATDGSSAVTSATYEVPPPALNIRLVLNCGTPSPSTAKITLVPTSAKPGAATIVSLAHFPANSRAALKLDNGSTLKTIATYTGGDGYTELTIPSRTALGAHRVVATSGATTASAPLTVVSTCVPAPPAGASRSVRDAYTVALITGNNC